MTNNIPQTNAAVEIDNARCIYMASEMIDHCAIELKDLIVSKFGEKAFANVPNHAFSASLKELSCIKLMLVLIEQGGNNASPTVTEFMQRSIGALDALIAGDSVKEIVMCYECFENQDLASGVSSSVLRRMNLHKFQDISGELSASIANGVAARLELYLAAMTSGILAIRRQLKERYRPTMANAA